MKTFLVLASVCLVVSFFYGCSNVADNGCATTERSDLNPGAKSGNGLQGRSAANPAFTYQGGKYVQGVFYSCLFVCDADLSDITQVYSVATPSTQAWWPCWSATGSSLCFSESPNASSSGNWYDVAPWGNYYIKAVDVTVGGNGRVSTSNTRTIVTRALSDSTKIFGHSWCPATSGVGAGKIAFIAVTPTQAKICLVSANGGAISTIYAVNLSDSRIRTNSLSWSPDGTKLVFVQRSIASSTESMKVIDTNGNLVNTLLSGSTNLSGCRWSNTGQDKIAYCSSTVSQTTATTADYSVYTIDASGSQSPQLVKTAATLAGWSPNNSELAIANGSNIARVNLSTLSVTNLGLYTSYLDWK